VDPSSIVTPPAPSVFPSGRGSGSVSGLAQGGPWLLSRGRPDRGRTWSRAKHRATVPGRPDPARSLCWRTPSCGACWAS